MARILVTGGAGFIGSHLVARLLRGGHEVVTLDRNPLGHWNPQARADCLVRDCRSHDLGLDVDLSGERPDFIYHLASTVGVSNVLGNPAECINNIIDSTRNVLGLGIPGIYFSTSEVYGIHTDQEKLAEDSELIWTSKKRWTYAGAKLIGEWLALEAGWKVVRLFNVIGERQNPYYGAVVPNFINQAQTGKDITIYGDGTQVRTFLDVRDCVEILDQLRDRSFDVVNVGGVHTVSVERLARMVLSASGRNIGERTYTPYERVYGKEFQECPARVPDLRKLHSLIGQPKYTPLETTLKELATHGLHQTSTASV